MDDLRYKQIETETEQESSSQKSKFAFTGFGRSTDLASEVDKVLAEAAKRKQALNEVITIEQQMKGADTAQLKVLSQMLDSANQKLNKLSEQAAQRRTKVAQDLTKTGIFEESKLKAKLQFRNSFKPKKFKLNSRVKVLKSHAPKIKNIKALSSGKGFAPVKSIGQITSKERSKNFSRQKTLSGHNA